MSAPECLRVLFERAFTSEGASSVQARRVDGCSVYMSEHRSILAAQGPPSQRLAQPVTVQ